MWFFWLLVKVLAAGYFFVLCGVLVTFAVSQAIRFVHDRQELVRTWRRPHRAIIGMPLESVCWLTTLLCEIRGRVLPQRKRWINLGREGSPPILLVHGYLHSPAYWTYFLWRLRAYGVRRVECVRLHSLTSSMEQMAVELRETIEHTLERHHAERVILVGHSLGGVVARYYLEALGGKNKVSHLVTIGSPHHGSYMAYFAPTRYARQLQPGSELLNELNTDESAPLAYRTLCFYSTMDNLIVPSHSAMLSRAENFAIYYSGHQSLLYNPRVIRHTAEFILK